MSQRSALTPTQRILGQVIATLEDARGGLFLLTNAPDPRLQFQGMKTMVLQGRSVTFVLQKLRTPEPSFDEWYAPIQAEMVEDPLLRYFSNLRTEIAKEGLPEPIMGEIHFVSEGGTGGIAEVEITLDLAGLYVDGRVVTPGTKETVGHPSAWVIRNIRLPNPPATHLGQPLNGTGIDYLGGVLIDYLRDRVVNPAMERFDNPIAK